jgi:hypothetical protein
MKKYNCNSPLTTATPPAAASGDPVSQPPLPEIFERDDGLFEIGMCPDAPGPFPWRKHAIDVARKEAEHAAA